MTPRMGTRTAGWRLKAYFAVLVLVFAAAAIGAAAYVFVQSDRDGRAEAERAATFTARTTAEQVGEAVAVLRATVEGLAATPNLADAFRRPEDCSLTFGGVGGVEIGHVDVLRDDGSVACSSREGDGGYRGEAWLDRALDGQLFEAPVPDAAAGGHAALAAAPFDGGVVAAFLALEPSGASLAKLYGGGRPVELLITSADGRTVIARSTGADRWVGESIAGTEFARAAGSVERPDLDGRTRLYARATIPGVGWRLYAGEEKASTLAAANRLRNRQLAIILVGLALVLAATLVVYRRVALPVKRLGAAVRETTGHAPPQPVEASGPAEVVELGEDINGLIAAVDRELAERARAERNYRLLFESSAVPMWIYDLETGRVLEVNEAAIGHYGHTREEFLGLRMEDIEAGRAGPGGRARHRRSDGSRIDVHTISHPVAFAGREARFVAAEDVGERDRLEDQLRQAQRMEAVGRLAGGIAHDFNNILAAIIGYSELLLAHTPAGDPRRGQAEQIKTAGERAAALTRQLLALGRRQALRPVVLDVDEVIASLQPMLRRLIRADVELAIDRAAEPARVRADRSQLERVLVNLAVNAGDAMAGHAGRLTIATAVTTLDERYFELHPVATGQPGRYVVLEVTDTGVGMDEETQSRIFEPFFTTKASEGTGLGLATVYGIVRQSGGFVSVESKLGRGTTFEVHLPAVDAPVERRPEVEPGAPPAARGRTVLLVEDDPAVRTVVRLMLEAHDLTVLEAEEGHAALRLSEEAEPGTLDLLVTDTVLPGPGGTELAGLVRARHPELPTLMMSGYSDRHVDGEAPLEPGTEFIAKPFTQADLGAKLAALLGRGDPAPASG